MILSLESGSGCELVLCNSQASPGEVNMIDVMLTKSPTENRLVYILRHILTRYLELIVLQGVKNVVISRLPI